MVAVGDFEIFGLRACRVFLRVVSFFAALGLVVWVILVGFEGVGMRVMSEFLFLDVHLLQVRVDGKKTASVLDDVLVRFLPVCIVRPIRFIIVSDMIVPLIVLSLDLNRAAKSSTYIIMRVLIWSW